MSEHETRETEAGTPCKVSYTLPRWEDWQAGQDWRTALEATVYLQGGEPVGRGVYVGGSVTFRTLPHRPDLDGWQYGGDYLYRVDDAEGRRELATFGGPEPTDRMRRTVREAVAPLLEAPSDGVRLRVLRDSVARRNYNAERAYHDTNRDTARLAARMLEALGYDETSPEWVAVLREGVTS